MFLSTSSPKMLSNCARVTCWLPWISIADDEGITNRSSCRIAVRATIAPPAHSAASASTTASTPSRPPSDFGSPPRTRTRTPRWRLRAGASSSTSSSNSVNSRRIVLFGATGPLSDSTISVAYSGSGASSTVIPRLEDPSLLRKPEQGRENRHPDYIPQVARLLPSTSPLVPFQEPTPSVTPPFLSGLQPYFY